MGGNIRLSEQHGVNPSVGKCFFCNEDKEVVLLGRLPGDQEAPRSAVYNKEPCEKCKGYMELGVVLISVDEKLSEEDRANPYRTGGWVVVKDDFLVRVLQAKSPMLLADILNKRVAFLPDDAWGMLGLPMSDHQKELTAKRAHGVLLPQEAGAGQTALDGKPG